MTISVQDGAQITARGPVSGVQVHRHMMYGPHALTEHPLDMVVALAISFMIGEQQRRLSLPPVTPSTVLAHLKETGVKSGNGRPIGRDAVYESMARTREKGYLRRVEPRENGVRSGPVLYEWYEWPAWNPDHVESEFSQVGTTSGNAGSGIAGSTSKKRKKPRSPQVGTTSGNAGSGNAGSTTPEDTFSQVGTTSGNAGSPPHPPEEVDTSSPYPLIGAQGPLSSQTHQEEGAAFTNEELAAGHEWLESLPYPWTLGARQARTAAPLLLERVTAQGWELDAELVAELTKDPGGVKRHAQVMVKSRIPNLVRRSLVDQSRRTDQSAPQTTSGPLRAAASCDRCDEYGWLLADDDDAPQRRCAHQPTSI